MSKKYSPRLIEIRCPICKGWFFRKYECPKDENGVVVSCDSCSLDYRNDCSQVTESCNCSWYDFHNTYKDIIVRVYEAEAERDELVSHNRLLSEKISYLRRRLHEAHTIIDWRAGKWKK